MSEKKLAGRLEIKSRHAPREEIGIEYNDDGRWQEGTAQQTSDSSARGRVLECLERATQGLTAMEIAEQTQVVPKTVQNIVSDLTRGAAPLLAVEGSGHRNDPRKYRLRNVGTVSHGGDEEETFDADDHSSASAAFKRFMDGDSEDRTTDPFSVESDWTWPEVRHRPDYMGGRPMTAEEAWRWFCRSKSRLPLPGVRGWLEWLQSEFILILEGRRHFHDEIYCMGSQPNRLCALRFRTWVFRTRGDVVEHYPPDVWQEATEEDAKRRYQAVVASLPPF
ncbi:MAG: hypothetical protein M3R02_25275 [Chloroflexota bacterium]|nr:hypothetical protein [Chloroflexota bacterium]